jgi:hypothetical protein
MPAHRSAPRREIERFKDKRWRSSSLRWHALDVLRLIAQHGGQFHGKKIETSHLAASRLTPLPSFASRAD